jgi:hypothetical protein
LRHHRPAVFFVIHLKVERVAPFSGPVFCRLVLVPNLRPSPDGRLVLIKRRELRGIAEHLVDHLEDVRA